VVVVHFVCSFVSFGSSTFAIRNFLVVKKLPL